MNALPSSPAKPAPTLPAQPRGLHAVVVGGGTMGADVATVLARGGCRVSVVEPQAPTRQALAQRWALQQFLPTEAANDPPQHLPGAA